MGETDDFEWDDTKDALNHAKHGIPLVAAARIFDDGDRIETISEASTVEETRIVAIGRANTRILTCVFVWRAGKRRVISVRIASRKERRAYEKTFGNG